MTSRLSEPVLPGSTIGIVGAGQLGRMAAVSARQMGYRVHTFTGGAERTPTGQVADLEVAAPFDDLEAMAFFVKGVDVVTFEFENVSTDIAEVAGDAGVPVRPGTEALHIAQNRIREKRFLADAGFPVAPYAEVTTEVDLTRALVDIGCPAILKTAAFGYDGKGQRRIETPEDASAAWAELGRQPCVLEAFVDFRMEASIIAARGLDGTIADYGIFENQHVDHVLDLTIAPGRLAGRGEDQARELMSSLLDELDYVGVLCVELFLTGAGALLINEIAPRPHNSGHLTIEAAVTGQFEQQIRAVCGLPLGPTDFRSPAAMANLLGDMWGSSPLRWDAVLDQPDLHVHLYGKDAARPGRKMGHLTALAPQIGTARAMVLEARERVMAATDRSEER